MALVAKTHIVHGKDDGSTVEIAQGDEPKGLPKDVVDELKKAGLVGEEEPTASQAVETEDLREENEELAAQVEDLKRQLAEAQKPAGK